MSGKFSPKRRMQLQYNIKILDLIGAIKPKKVFLFFPDSIKSIKNERTTELNKPVPKDNKTFFQFSQFKKMHLLSKLTLSIKEPIINKRETIAVIIYKSVFLLIFLLHRFNH